MKVAVYGADSSLLGEYEVHHGVGGYAYIELTSEHEVEIWGRRAAAVSRDIAHLEALRSGTLNVSKSGVTTLDDGTPVTPEIMRSMGWRLDGDSWVMP